MITSTRRGDIAILTMADGKANLLDLEFCERLTAIFEECNESAARAMVLVGSGTIFSAGVDLVRVVSGGSSYVERFLPALGRTFQALFEISKPVVAAVNGHAIAGGCILACAADHRVMARGPGRIGIPELIVGVPFPTIALEIVRSVVPVQHIRTLALGGATLTAEEALARGVVDEVVEPDRLIDSAVAVAEMFASRPADAFAVAKQQLRAEAMARVRWGQERFDPTVRNLWAAPETIEAIRLYVSRTLKK